MASNVGKNQQHCLWMLCVSEWCENWCRKFHKTVAHTIITRSSLKYRSLNVIKIENGNNKIKIKSWNENRTKDFKKFMAFAVFFHCCHQWQKKPLLEGWMQLNILKSAEKRTLTNIIIACINREPLYSVLYSWRIGCRFKEKYCRSMLIALFIFCRCCCFHFK